MPNDAAGAGSRARVALAEALANELGLDLDDDVMKAIDKVLISLWLLGYKIVPVDP